MKQLASAAIAMPILLAGCASMNDANEENFSAAVAQYFDERGERCLFITTLWPVVITDRDLRPQKGNRAGIAGSMAALEAVGLAKSEDDEVAIRDSVGKPTGDKAKIKRYNLTEAAKPFERRTEVVVLDLTGRTKETRIELCWGKTVLSKVVSWEGPTKVGAYVEAIVKYQSRTDGIAEWAKRPESLAAFPEIARNIKDDGKQVYQLSLRLTKTGWKAKALTN
ncbi:hypothetical protein [Herbaspirillum aquaticum]|nr:hypothetical protein [Herbaspirillum aquaticum]